ncbi:DinB family protein [Desulfosporosinus orientis DSM 765]|uniref:DinB family protein n=1 Tax=Desulfosporosinus orientis (strain ATCC 19365 / DSM 765 / NCIMB 8382 / VKM B-1628 / Singapore I) TaxID=768706 RepID=G7WB56_DESOD|nr:DinB family protein [Desulfosporosinus orientis]AET67837.1 DinB family protein [Desulfosporosinus orientis DSM 765]
MSTRKDIILTQLRSCRDQDGWFAPLSVALRGLTAEQAAKNVGQSTNSIFGIVHHLVFWNERYLQRFKDSSLPPLKISNVETFVKDPGEIVERWDDLYQRLDNLFVQWEEAIIKCDDAKLDSRTHPDRDESWWTSLAHLAIHNAHHIGQIVHIRKEQGLWETWFE